MKSFGANDFVDIDKIHISSYNPRIKVEDMNELQKSINDKGLLQPLVVRPIANGFEIVAGNRRFKSCLNLGWSKIPCHIVKLSDKEAFEVSLIENIQRKNLHPIDEGEAFKKYTEQYGWGGVSELSKKIGKSSSYISKRMRLLTLPKDIKDNLINGNIDSSIAYEILSIEDEYLLLELGNIISSGELTRKETRLITKKIKSEDQKNVYDNDILPVASTENPFLNKADKTLHKLIVILRTTLWRLDEIIETLDENEILLEFLMEYRLILHNQISMFHKARKKLDYIYD